MSQWGALSLHVIPAGRIPPNPSELLGSENMATLLRQLEHEFDVILCDAPPLLPVTDAALLSRVTKSVMVVVAASKATRHQLTLAKEALHTVGAQISGFVLITTLSRARGSSTIAD